MQLGAGLSPEDLELLLHDNADGIENIRYFKGHVSDESIQIRDELAQEYIKLNDIESEKKEAVAQFDELIKPVKANLKGLVGEIRDNGKFVDEKCYKIIYLDEGVVAYFNERGINVMQRPITPQDKQTNIFKPQLPEMKIAQ